MVLSVNGKFGDVTLSASDVRAMPESYVPGWNDISGKPTSYPPSSHNHSWSEVTEKPTTYPPSSHFHRVDGEFVSISISGSSSSPTPIPNEAIGYFVSGVIRSVSRLYQGNQQIHSQDRNGNADSDNLSTYLPVYENLPKNLYRTGSAMTVIAWVYPSELGVVREPTEDEKKEMELQKKAAIFISNGQSRKDRLQQQQFSYQRQHQQKITATTV